MPCIGDFSSSSHSTAILSMCLSRDKSRLIVAGLHLLIFSRRHDSISARVIRPIGRMPRSFTLRCTRLRSVRMDFISDTARSRYIWANSLKVHLGEFIEGHSAQGTGRREEAVL